ERRSEGENLGGGQSTVGEGKGKSARVSVPSGQSKSADFTCSVEGADRPKPARGRKIRGGRQGIGGEAWKELRQHQCLVPHHCQRSKGNQESCTWQICLGILMGSWSYFCWCDGAPTKNRSLVRTTHQSRVNS